MAANKSFRQNSFFAGANGPMPTSAPISAGQAIRTEQSASREFYRGNEAEESNLTFAERKRRLAKTKMHPSLQALAERLAQGGSALTADDRRLLKGGKVEIQVWLEDASVEVRQALKDLGFELIGEPRVAKILLGRIPVEKLGELAEITSVRYVGPLGR